MQGIGTTFAVASLVVAAAALWRGEARSPDKTQDSALEQLRVSVEALERRVEVLDARTRVVPPVPPAPADAGAAPAAAPADVVQAVVDRLAQLEGRIVSMEGREEGRRPERARKEPPRPEDLRPVHATVMDRAASPEARLAALRRLRAAGERTNDELLAALELLQEERVAPETRAALVGELAGLTFLELKAPMLKLLTSSTHEETRRSAVHALARFMDDAAVSEAVVRASEQDESEAVRREASKRVEEWRARTAPPVRDR
jgi:hypothetical protein